MFKSPTTTTTPPRTPPPSLAPKVPTSISSTGIVFEASPKHAQTTTTAAAAAREHVPFQGFATSNAQVDYEGEGELFQKTLLPATPFQTMQTPQQLPMYASTGRRSGGFTPLGLMGSPTPPVLHFAKSPKLPTTPRASDLPVLETVKERGLLESFNSGEDSVFGEVGGGSISLDHYEVNPAYFSPIQHQSHPVLIHLTSNLLSSPPPTVTATTALEEEDCINDEEEGSSIVFMAGELSVLEDEEVVVEEPVVLFTPIKTELVEDNFAVRSIQFTDDDDDDDNNNNGKEWTRKRLSLVVFAGVVGMLIAFVSSLCISLQDVKELSAWLGMLLVLFLVWYMRGGEKEREV